MIEANFSSTAEYAKENDLIPSTEPIRLEDLIEMATKIAGDIQKMAQDISKVANHVDEAVVANRSKLDRIFDNFEETSDNFREFSEDVKWHPWKVLAKGKEKTKDEMIKARAERLKEKAAMLEAKSFSFMERSF